MEFEGLSTPLTSPLNMCVKRSVAFPPHKALLSQSVPSLVTTHHNEDRIWPLLKGHGFSVAVGLAEQYLGHLSHPAPQPPQTLQQASVVVWCGILKYE